MTAVVRHVEAIYCDDIRQEVGNKISYIGVYAGELNVSAPVVLPKLCIAINVVTDKSDPFESLAVRVLQGEDNVEIVSTGLVPIPKNIPVPDSGNACIVGRFMFVMAPFQIDRDTVLRVRAKTEREELKGPALRIRIVSDPEQPAVH